MGMEKQVGAWMYGLIKNQNMQTQQGQAYNKYLQALLQKGGAEGWVQVEIAIFFESIPAVVNVHREKHIYQNPNKKVDFALECKNDVGQWFGYLVELKCESLFHSAELGRSTMDHTQYAEVQVDVDKLKYERSPEFASNGSCVLVVTFSREAEQAIDNHFQHILNDDPECKQELELQHFGEWWKVCVYALPVS